MYVKLALSTIIVALATVPASAQPADDSSEDGVRLMGTLADWMYPDSEFGGATMSDGGNLRLQSTNCRALLTTSDPVDKVVEFYTEKLNVTNDSVPKPISTDIAYANPQAVCIQDDSQGRPVELRVVTVHRDKTTTTLVISRAKGEDKTHIAWSHYVRHGDKQ